MKKKQIEEMSNHIQNAVDGCSTYWSSLIAEYLYNAGYRKQEWISVKDRMPEEKLEKITYASQDIATGEIVESEERMSYVSEIVAVLDYRHLGEGEFDLVPDYDVTYNGQWGYNMCVKYWMPLPEIPKMKGGAE